MLIPKTVSTAGMVGTIASTGGGKYSGRNPIVDKAFDPPATSLTDSVVLAHAPVSSSSYLEV